MSFIPVGSVQWLQPVLLLHAKNNQKIILHWILKLTCRLLQSVNAYARHPTRASPIANQPWVKFPTSVFLSLPTSSTLKPKVIRKVPRAPVMKNIQFLSVLSSLEPIEKRFLLWLCLLFRKTFLGGGETGSMYVLSYEVRWCVHI